MLSFAGCSGGEQGVEGSPGETTDASLPVRGDMLVVGLNSDVDVLNPVVTGSSLGQELAELLFPTLARATFDCRLEFQPGLAERWEWSEDGTALTFHLNKEARWSDGQPLDAADVAMTLERIADPRVGSSYRGYLQNLRTETPLEVIDPHTVVVHFDHRYDPTTMLSHAVAFPLIPEHIIASIPPDQLRGADFGSNPLGAGPFVFERWIRDQELVFKRNDAPVGISAPHLDRMILRVIPDYSTRLLELQSGGIDLMKGIEIEDLERVQRVHPEIHLERGEETKSEFIIWNLQDERFSDVRVRRALAHVIDVDTLIEALLTADGKTYGRRAVGTIPPVLCDLHNDQIKPLQHDLEKAKALFAEAGWADSDGDGWLDRDGKRLAFDLATSSGNSRRERALVIVQEQLRAAGVDVTLQNLEFNTFTEKLMKGEFDAVLAGMSAQLFVDPTPWWHSGDQPYNVGKYANPEVDALIEQGLAATDPEEAKRCWLQMQALIYEDQPYCFLYWRDEVVGVHERFHDVDIGVLGVFHGIENWWVPEKQQRYRGKAK
jgi:peptide/nickel transport system substrate-binding protein